MGYRSGQIVSVWLFGALCGVVLYSAIRHAEAFEAERAMRAWPAMQKSAPREIRRGIDSEIGCWAPAVHAKALGWAE